VGAHGEQQPLNALFRNDGVKGFTKVLTKASLLNRGDHAVQLVDFDNDGGLDLKTQSIREVKPAEFYGKSLVVRQGN
jgi:hypothetical protein